MNLYNTPNTPIHNNKEMNSLQFIVAQPTDNGNKWANAFNSNIVLLYIYNSNVFRAKNIYISAYWSI